jgi:hypothetical protein
VLRLLGFLSLFCTVAFIAAGSATAKGPNVASICGASGCVTLRGESAVQPLASWVVSWWYTPFVSRAAPAPAPYYSIRLRDRSSAKWVLVYVPRRHAISVWQRRVPPDGRPIGPYWRTVPKSADPAIRRFVRNLSPYVAPACWRR